MTIRAKPGWAQWREPEGGVTAIRFAASLLALNIFVVACVITAAQTPEPETPSSAPANASPSEPQGFFDAFGNWVQQGVTNVGAGFGAVVGAVGGQAGQAAKGAADVARNAATSVTTQLPVAGVISGRERCILAPNGAPDCRVAAEALCRAKGYVSGASVDFEAVEKCPPATRVSGHNPPERVCTSEHFVTRALCQ